MEPLIYFIINLIKRKKYRAKIIRVSMLKTLKIMEGGTRYPSRNNEGGPGEIHMGQFILWTKMSHVGIELERI